MCIFLFESAAEEMLINQLLALTVILFVWTKPFGQFVGGPYKEHFVKLFENWVSCSGKCGV